MLREEAKGKDGHWNGMRIGKKDFGNIRDMYRANLYRFLAEFPSTMLHLQLTQHPCIYNSCIVQY